MSPHAPNPVRFHLNGERVESAAGPGRLLLDHLRRDRRAVGTKEGCREGDCGACTVLHGRREPTGEFRYRAVPSCMLLLAHIHGDHVVTIEGLRVGAGLNGIQRAVVENGGSQCGFCTPGFIVSFTGFVLNATAFTTEEAVHAISGNLCRCTGYVSLVRAARDLLGGLLDLPEPGLARQRVLVDAGLLPEFFAREAIEANPAELAPGDSEGLLLGGGTDLIVQRGEALNHVVPYLARPHGESRSIRKEGEWLCLPGEATFEALRGCDLLKELWPTHRVDLERFASPIIRERASLAGNIQNASPIADGTAIFLALGAQLLLKGRTGERRVNLDEYFHDYKRTELQSGERIYHLLLPPGGPGHRFHFGKLSKREFLDIASVNSALAIQVADGVIRSARLSAGGVAPIPLALHRTAQHLVGQPLCAQTVLDAVPVMEGEIVPISDVRGSAEYKRLGLRQLFFAHFLDLFPDEIEEAALLEVTP